VPGVQAHLQQDLCPQVLAVTLLFGRFHLPGVGEEEAA
jgi:hypothetical protein